LLNNYLTLSFNLVNIQNLLYVIEIPNNFNNIGFIPSLWV